MFGPTRGFQEWLWAQALLTVVLSLLVVGALKLWTDSRSIDSYNWRRSRNFQMFVLGIAIAIALAVWYRVDSHELWVARSDALAGVEYFVDAPGSPEIIDVDVDSWPAWWWSDRPRPRQNTCQTHPFFGSAEITSVKVQNALALLEEVENSLQADGWETELRTGEVEGRPVGSTRAFRGEQSLTIEGPNQNSGPDLDRFFVRSNLSCNETEPES